jgi:integrase
LVKFKLPKGVHRVRRKLKTGIKYHFYAWRGGPKFWVDVDKYPNKPEFFQAYADVTKRPEPLVATTQILIDDFLSSASMPKGARSKDDLTLWANRFGAEFGSDPMAMFEERASRGELNRWRAKWKHSPKQHDVAGTHAVRILNWGVEEGRIREHHCHRLPRLYQADRSEIIWTPEDRDAVAKIAPPWVMRILEVGCETGLRPSDLVDLELEKHIEVTGTSRRLRVKTAKRNRFAYIPVTQRLGEIIDQTPQGQQFLLAGDRKERVSARWASNQITKWRRIANVSLTEDGREKTLNDTRGTAATKLLNAGLTLAQISNYMGWSIRYAANVIEHYATVSPSESDAVLAKLNEAKESEDAFKL